MKKTGQVNSSAVDGHRKAPTLAILAYHKVGTPPRSWKSWFYVPENVFSEQLRYLRDERWTAIDVTLFLRGLVQPSRLPRRSVLITFDDGCQQFVEAAMPLLRHFGYPAVHFVPTQFIGGYNSFDAGNEPDEAIFTWKDLRRLERYGISIQSHGVSHRAFSEIGPAEREMEVFRSKEMLERKLGKTVQLYAYAYGDPGKDSRQVCSALRRARYRAAFLYGGGAIRLPVRGIYRMARVAMGPDTDLSFVLG